MEISLFDNSDKVPQSKDKIRIESLKVTPYPDRFRVFIEIGVTPFRDRPNLILAMRNTEGKLIADLSIIETMHSEMEFTMHVRGVPDPAGDYTLTADLFYESKNPPQDRHEVDFVIPAADDVEADDEA
ncbi:MAG TPA: hypothetical protein VHL11_03230 [Phototrophicaceae bacterium]|jgi:hypothetical protein|nr:hypothetical protein [Phototrophicaceae bacterium]